MFKLFQVEFGCCTHAAAAAAIERCVCERRAQPARAIKRAVAVAAAAKPPRAAPLARGRSADAELERRQHDVAVVVLGGDVEDDVRLRAEEWGE